MPRNYQTAMLKSRKKRSSRSDQALSRLSGHVDFSGKLPKKAAVKKGDVGPPPRGEKPGGSEGESLSEGLARAASVTPTRGRAGRIAKSALSMASAGAALGKSYGDYKAKQKKARASAKGQTPSQAVFKKGQATKVRGKN